MNKGLRLHLPCLNFSLSHTITPREIILSNFIIRPNLDDMASRMIIFFNAAKNIPTYFFLGYNAISIQNVQATLLTD